MTLNILLSCFDGLGDWRMLVVLCRPVSSVARFIYPSIFYSTLTRSIAGRYLWNSLRFEVITVSMSYAVVGLSYRRTDNEKADNGYR
jgi:hypothetical protein